MADLKDKVAIITGAGQGVGKGIAIALAKDGMNDKALLFLGELVAVGTSAHTTLLKTPY